MSLLKVGGANGPYNLISTIQKHSATIISIFLSASLYFRWLPIYSGLLLFFVLTLLIACSYKASPSSLIKSTLAIVGVNAILHLTRITFDSLTLGLKTIFLVDILNVGTVVLFILYLRTNDIQTFIRVSRKFQILAGIILSVVPSSLLFLLLAHNLNKDLAIAIASSVLDFMRTNVDYNIVAFLLLLSLNSLFFSTIPNKAVYLFSTILSLAVLHSSSRRAFLLLIISIPTFAILTNLFKINRAKSALFGIATSLFISMGLIIFAWATPARHHLINTATVKPLLRPLSLFMLPEDFNRLHYKVVHYIDDYKAFSTEDDLFSQTIGELALAPRRSRIDTALSIINNFTPQQHIFGDSFHLQTFGRANGLKFDYPHNFLLTTYISTGLIGLSLTIAMLTLAAIGYFRAKTSWKLELMLAFLICLAFSLTSGFSHWSFFPLMLYTSIGLLAFFNSYRGPLDITIRKTYCNTSTSNKIIENPIK